MGSMEEARALLRRIDEDERGLNTAELLGNAALAIAALVVIWGALQALGVDVVEWVRGQLGI
jgi:hypothetical protein